MSFSFLRCMLQSLVVCICYLISIFSNLLQRPSYHFKDKTQEKRVHQLQMELTLELKFTNFMSPPHTLTCWPDTLGTHSVFLQSLYPLSGVLALQGQGISWPGLAFTILPKRRRYNSLCDLQLRFLIFSTDLLLSSVQFSSVAQWCLTFCNPMDCSRPGLLDYHQLPEFTQTHAHWVSDATQPFHPLLSPSPAFNLSQHHGLFRWVTSLHQVAKVLEFQLQHQSFQWISRNEFLKLDFPKLNCDLNSS